MDNPVPSLKSPGAIAEVFDGTMHDFIESYATRRALPAGRPKINLDLVVAEKTRLGLELQDSVHGIVSNLDDVTRKILEIKGLNPLEKFLSLFGERGKNQAVRHHLGRVQRQDLSGSIMRTIDLSRFYEQSLDMLIQEGRRELIELRKLRDRLNEDYTRCFKEAQEFKGRMDGLDKEIEGFKADVEQALPEARGEIQRALDSKLDARSEVHTQWQDRSIRGNLALENYKTAKNYVEAFDISNNSMMSIRAKLLYSVDQTAQILRKTVSVFRKAETVRGSANMFDAYRKTLDNLHRITGEAVEAIAAETARILDLSLNDPHTQQERRRQIEQGAVELREALTRNYERLTGSRVSPPEEQR